MTTIYALAQGRWFGSALLLTSSLVLPFLGQTSELFWGIAALGSATALGGLFFENRWIVGLVGAFTASLVAFYLRSFGEPLGTVALLLVVATGTALTLWLLPTRSDVDLVLAYGGGIALGELFLILIVWPINYPSRSLLLTTGAFLLFELIDRRARRSPLRTLVGSLGIAAVAVAAIILTADWYSF